MCNKEKLCIYLAGPINCCTDDECNDWRDLFIVKTKSAIAGKYEFRNPMVRDYREQYTELHMAAEIVELDKRDIDLSDIVIANITKHSAGTAMEMLYAWENSKVVIAVANPGVKLSPWHIYHSTKIVYSLDEAVQWLNAYIY